MRKCEKCGAPNPANISECYSCSHPFVAQPEQSVQPRLPTQYGGHCSHCGKSLPCEANFCASCGRELQSDHSREVRQQTGGQRGTLQHDADLMSGLQPRSFWGTFSMIAGVTSLPFALLWSWLFAQMNGMSFGNVLSVGIWGGLGFGVLFGFTMAFFLKGEMRRIPVSDPAQFRDRLTMMMAQIGYIPETQTEKILTYRPSYQAGLLSGRITVAISSNEAVMVGPTMHVRKLSNSIMS